MVELRQQAPNKLNFQNIKIAAAAWKLQVDVINARRLSAVARRLSSAASGNAPPSHHTRRPMQSDGRAASPQPSARAREAALRQELESSRALIEELRTGMQKERSARDDTFLPFQTSV